jgi:hypothetical protein
MAAISIHGANDLGSREGSRWFELYGSFPGADDALRRYRAMVWANNAWLNARIDFESPGQINVAVPVVAAGAACTFSVRLGDGGGPTSNLFGPVIAQKAIIEIHGLRDLGRNVAGIWDVELYGAFGTDPLTATVTCDGQDVQASITHHSAGQVNVAFPLPTKGASCTFELNRADKQRTPCVSRVLGRGPVQMSPSIGAYFWGGMVPPEPSRHDALIEGLSRLAQAGFRAARIRLTPELLRPELNVYNYDLPTWKAELSGAGSFLGLAARSSYYQRAFNVADLQTFVLTAYDAASMGPDGTGDNFYRPAWLADPENADAVRAEYRDLALALCETQRGTGKRFIIANWETDNHIYVGGAYGYALKVGAGQTPTPSSPLPAERLGGFIRWFQLRKEGLDQGNAEAQANGWTGVRVDDAVEFATYLLLQGVGVPSTLFDIIPVVKPAVASYSAWESINAGRLDEDLPALKRQLGPGTELILGEFGHTHMADDPAAEWRFAEAVKAAKRSHVSLITVWEAFTTIDQADGLLDVNGNERPVLRRLRDMDAKPMLDMSGPIAILGIRDRGDSRDDGQRHFELYGRFPAHASQTYRAKLSLSDTGTIPATITYASEHQINIAVQVQSFKYWCIFRVDRSLDNASSNEFGPYLVAPMKWTP